MTEFIAKEFSKTVLETIKRFALEKSVPESEIQVYFGLDSEGENVYKICHDWQPYKTVGFTDNGILKSKVDFTGKSRYVPDALKDILQAVAAEEQMDATEVGIMVVKGSPVGLYLYNGTKPVKAVSFEDLFSKLKMA